MIVPVVVPSIVAIVVIIFCGVVFDIIRFDVFVLFAVFEALRPVGHTIKSFVDRTFVLVVVVETALVLSMHLVVGSLVVLRVTPVGDLRAEGTRLF